MPMSLAAPSSARRVLLVAALLAAPALASAQGRAAPAPRVEAVVISVPSFRLRTAPSPSSLSIEEFTQGTVFPLAPDEYQTKDWYGVMLDGRIAYIAKLAVTPRMRGSRAVIAEPVEVATVSQAGAPAAAASAVAPAAAPAATFERAPAVAPPAAPAPTTEPAPQRMAEQPAPQPTAAPAAPAEPKPAPAADSKADQPVFNARRAGMNLTVGLLGSVTPIKSTTGLTPTAHVSGVSFLGVRYRAVGLYGAPEFGQGGGYRSTMLGGGMSLDLISFHMLRITALGGYTTYSETTMPADTTVAPVTQKLQGPSVGGMASIPLFGPLRLAYRGQYVMAQVGGVPARMTRHYAGLVF
jgi:hypothetical protein